MPEKPRSKTRQSREPEAANQLTELLMAAMREPGVATAVEVYEAAEAVFARASTLRPSFEMTTSSADQEPAAST